MGNSPLRKLVPTLEREQNGLELVVVPMPWTHVVVAQLSLRVGSRYEGPHNNGISHFLEHMLYRGTPSHPSAHALALAFEERGGSLTAFTATDHGTLSVAAPAETFEQVLPLLAEVYTTPLFSGIDVEKGIVREEILEGMDDRGTRIDADDLTRELMFGEHALGLPITGTLEDLDHFDVPALHTHHARHYTGTNTILIIAGPLEAERAHALGRAGFAGLRPGEAPACAPPPPQSEPRFRYVRHASSQTELRIGFRAAGVRDRLEPATELLLRILDDGMATRLYHRLSDLHGLCYDVSASYEPFLDVGAFELQAETAHQNAERVMAEMLGMLSELREEGPSERELDKAKRRHRWQLEELLDQPTSVAEYYGLERLLGNSQSPQDRCERIAAVTRDDALAAAHDLFRREGLSLVAVGKLRHGTRESLARAIERF